ncbi:MAG: MBL fold metallo-hydrolase [Eubacterium sp.]
MKLASISSGSKGNCILVENKGTSLLVDAGISKKRIEEGLDSFGKSPENIDGIVITHEHSDHIKGLGVLLRKYEIPVYGTEKTIEYILNSKSLGEMNSDLFNVIKPEHDFFIKDIELMPLSISHDAVDPVCYRFMDGKNSCAVVTDLGEYNDRLIGYLQGLNAILAESNHDVGMLQTGPYPYQLKQRIWGSRGHLSNESCGRLINDIISDKLSHIILGHLSQENNYPELAYQAVRNEINFADHDFCSDDLDIKVASRVGPSCLIEF